MSTQPKPPDYEVRCHHCNVSFPVGTKRCVHCGEKIGRTPFFQPTIQRTTDEQGMPVFHDPDAVQETEETEEAEEAEEAEAETQGRSGRFLRVGFTLVWLVLAFLSAAVRACQDG